MYRVWYKHGHSKESRKKYGFQCFLARVSGAPEAPGKPPRAIRGEFGHFRGPPSYFTAKGRRLLMGPVEPTETACPHILLGLVRRRSRSGPNIYPLSFYVFQADAPNHHFPTKRALDLLSGADFNATCAISVKRIRSLASRARRGPRRAEKWFSRGGGGLLSKGFNRF